MRFRSYVGGIVLATTALAVLQARSGDVIDWQIFAVLMVLLWITDAFPVTVPHAVLTVSFVLVVVAIIQLDPLALTLLGVLTHIPLVIKDSLKGRGSGKPVQFAKFAFNMFQMGLAHGLAAETYSALGGQPHISSAILGTVLLAITGATLAFFIINSSAVAGALALIEGATFTSIWSRSFGWLPPTYVAFGALGLVLASLLQAIGFLALPLLLVPLMVARAVFHSYKEMEDAYEATVKAFVSAIEAKDVYTRGHSERVTEYAMMIAHQLGMTEEESKAFRYSGLLHDIGKLAIRKSVLIKPAALTKEEYDEIKKHPTLGARIVQEIDFLKLGTKSPLGSPLDAVLYHHERLDGSGYPAGLSGDLVPGYARIMAVADTYDAMTSTRAYRAASTPEEAIAELKRCAGTLFESKYVDMFIESLADEEAQKAFKERTTFEPKVAASAIT